MRDEVRKLAERTQKAIGEVETIITTLQNTSSAAIREMSDTESSVHSGVEIINSTREAFTAIVDSTVNANSDVANVEVSVNEQVAAINSINDSTHSIASGIEECVNVVSHVTVTAGELQTKSQQAYSAIDFFKV